MTVRRFPPPWSVEEQPACFVVRDHNEQALAYIYYGEEPGRRSAAQLLTKDEARRIPANIAKLPELVRARIQAAAKLSREASSWDILALVSGARRRWYAVMHAEEQKCMCQY